MNLSNFRIKYALIGLTLLIGNTAIPAVASNSFSSKLLIAQAEGRCAQVIGDWAWDTRAFPATIYNNGTIDGYDGGRFIKGTWQCRDANEGRIVVSWNTGYTDTLTLSPNGQTLVGFNNSGSVIVVKRR
jgi:hypothetical protein